MKKGLAAWYLCIRI